MACRPEQLRLSRLRRVRHRRSTGARAWRARSAFPGALRPSRWIPSPSPTHWRALYQPSLESVRSGAAALDQAGRPAAREPRTAARRRTAWRSTTFPSRTWRASTRAWERSWTHGPTPSTAWRASSARFAIAPISNGHIAGMLQLARFGGLPWDAILGAEISHSLQAAAGNLPEIAGGGRLRPGEARRWWPPSNGDLRRGAGAGHAHRLSCAGRTASTDRTRTPTCGPEEVSGRDGRSRLPRWQIYSAVPEKYVNIRHMNAANITTEIAAARWKKFPYTASKYCILPCIATTSNGI